MFVIVWHFTFILRARISGDKPCQDGVKLYRDHPGFSVGASQILQTSLGSNFRVRWYAQPVSWWPSASGIWTRLVFVFLFCAGICLSLLCGGKGRSNMLGYNLQSAPLHCNKSHQSLSITIFSPMIFTLFVFTIA